jgi:hypothetical protein
MAHTIQYARALSEAKLMHWEAGYFLKGPRVRDRREAKRKLHRANRRYSKDLCRTLDDAR